MEGGPRRKAKDARGFYGVITVSVLAALVIQYSPISPMKASFGVRLSTALSRCP